MNDYERCKWVGGNVMMIEAKWKLWHIVFLEKTLFKPKASKKYINLCGILLSFNKRSNECANHDVKHARICVSFDPYFLV